MTPLVNRRWACCVMAVGLWSSGALMAAQGPPSLEVVLTPALKADRIDRLHVSLRLSAPRLAAGQALLRMPLVLVGTPTAAYEAQAIMAHDDEGELTLSTQDEPPGTTGTYRRWLTSRATVGEVHVRYSAAPRAVSRETRNGPLYDLRGEAGGIIGAGHYFLALPPGDHPYQVALRWDLSGSPKGWRGVWSLGEGPQSQLISLQDLSGSFFAAGPVKSYPPQGEGSFGLYWLSDPPFDMAELAKEIQVLYRSMSRFFEDPDSSYRVFVRANPHPGSGGTALPRSFMFGYGADAPPTSGRDMQMLLAHEMTHNWPLLDGEEHPEIAWYNEGMAEYYSAVLSWRAGVIDLKKFEDTINAHASGYYTNPYVGQSSAEVGKRFWQDANAQRVPYGRGFMYLARVDAQVRARTAGRKSLDDLVLGVLWRQRQGQKVANAEWVTMVQEILGPVAEADFRAMMAGRRIVMPAQAFGPCFKHISRLEQPFELGFDDMRKAVVSQLNPRSAAAKAGLREWDVILSMTPLNALLKDPAKRMSVTVQRDGVERTVSFLPRTAAVISGRWQRIQGVPPSRCRL